MSDNKKVIGGRGRGAQAVSGRGALPVIGWGCPPFLISGLGRGRHSTSSVSIGTASNETSTTWKKRYVAPTESSQAKRKSWRPDIGEGHGLLVKDNGMMVENVSTMDKCYIYFLLSLVARMLHEDEFSFDGMADLLLEL